jgi:mono/diheme cytochrome c family protein
VNGRRILLGLAALLLVVVVTCIVIAWRPAIARIAVLQRSDFSQAAIARGAQLALIGNCATCHTAPGGGDYAGGLEIPTPFGVIHATNITPDAETGIGAWSLAAFQRALHEGIARDGSHLYPAFPYDHFAHMTNADVEALYAFLMTRPPIHAPATPNSLRFPFNLRPILAGWNLLFLNTEPFRPDPAHDAAWNRGAYLAEAAAHCGACHTPRNIFQAEETSKPYGGGVTAGWYAPALDASSPAPVPWTAPQLESFLRTGMASEHGAANGPMQDVSLNLAQVDAADVRAIAEYIADQGGTPSPARMQAAQQAHAIASGAQPSPSLPSGDGAAIYAGACAICHQDGWRPGVAAQPPLALSTALAADNPINAIRILLDGRQPPEGEAGTQMPAFATMLSDRQIATVLGWLRHDFAGKPDWTGLQDTVTRLRDHKEGP